MHVADRIHSVVYVMKYEYGNHTSNVRSALITESEIL